MDARPILITLFLVICVITPGCTSVSGALSPRQNELAGPSWHLVSYSVGERTLAPAGPQTNITLKFGEDGNVSGFLDGCRRYSGRFSTAGETISVTNLSEINEGACPSTPQTVDIKNIYFSLLEKSPRFNIDEDTLNFGYFDAEKYLVFNRT